MDTNAKISVIIPVYKVEPYLRQCLDSVVNQTYRNLEIIVIDDGSPDNCGKICDEYATRDSRIIVIHKKNGGLSAARNDGIERATGKWLTFVDSDDWCELDYYERIMSALNNRDVDIFCTSGHYREIGTRTKAAPIFCENVLYSHRKEMDGLMALVLNPYYDGLRGVKSATDLGAPWDKLYKTDFINSIHIRFDTASKAWEDSWFNFRAFDKAQRVGGCTYTGYHYRLLDTSITKGFNPTKPQINYDFITKINTYIELREPNAMIRQAINIMSLGLIRNALNAYYFNPANTRPYKETAREIKNMKDWPYFSEAILNKDNQYLKKKRIVFKLLLRLPWVWPLKLMYDVNEKMRKAG